LTPVLNALKRFSSRPIKLEILTLESLILASEAGAYPIGASPCITIKHYARFVRRTHSSLLYHFVSHDENNYDLIIANKIFIIDEEGK
jgi:hypothetical protein